MTRKAQEIYTAIQAVPSTGMTPSDLINEVEPQLPHG